MSVSVHPGAIVDKGVPIGEDEHLRPHPQDRYVLAGGRLRCDPARD